MSVKMFKTTILIFVFYFIRNSSQETSMWYKGLLNTQTGNIDSFPSNCSDILNEFAQNAANLTLCSIINARPIRLCERCINDYVKFHNSYEELLDTAVNHSTCGSLYMSHDRLEAVKEYHNNILSIWDKANCNDCFDWFVEKPVTSNSTNTFNKMFNDTMECILSSMADQKQAVCEKCQPSYSKLDDFYKSLSKDAIGVDVICMDIVDMMNTTRSIWSKTLGCCQLRKTPEVVFLCCTGIISMLPFLFYISLRYFGPIRDFPNVLLESRFKQTFLRSRSTN